MKVMLAAFVVGIHTVGNVDYSGYPASGHIAYALDDLFHVANPMFVMISAALMAGGAARMSLGEFYRKRIIRLMVPFLPLAGFFMLVRIFRDGEGVGFVVSEAIRGMPYYHLWFVPMLVAVVVLMPLLVRIAHELKWIGFWSITLVVYLFMPRSRIIWVFLPYAAYALMGIRLYDFAKSRTFSLHRHAFAVVGIVIGLVFWGVNVCFLRTGAQNPLPVVFHTFVPVGLFFVGVLAALPASCTKTRIVAIVSSLADCTYGVYLVHPAFKVLGGFVAGIVHPGIREMVFFSVVLVSTFATVWLVSRTALGAKVLGVGKSVKFGG